MTTTTADELKVKGSNFISMQGALRTLRGEVVAANLLKELRGACGEGMRLGTLLASGWYPYSWYRELLDATRRVTGEGDAITTAVSREGVRRDVNGVYRVVFRLLSPATLLSQGGKAIRMYYDRGELRFLESRPGYVRARYDGFTGFDRVAWLDVRAGSEQLLEMSGARQTQVKPLTGGGDGDDHMEMEATWTAR